MQAQIFHGGLVFKQVVGPNGTSEVKPGDLATATITFINTDECDDSLTVTNIFDCVDHFPGPPAPPTCSTPNLLLQAPPAGIGSGQITLARFESVTVTHTYLVLPGDENLPGGILTDSATVQGWDNRDSILCQGVRDQFVFTFPNQLHVTNPTNPPCVCTNVIEAVSDSHNKGGSDHALWLPGISTNLIFTPNPGSWVENPDGTATLTGRVHSRTNVDCGFIIDVQLSGRTTVPPAGSPKLDLDSDEYVPNGPVDPSTFYYYPVWSGTLTGFGPCWEGAILDIVRTGPAFQVGAGANQKNINFGASGWFNWTVRQQPNNGVQLPRTGRGDFNIDIGPCPCFCLPCVIHYPFNSSSNVLTKLDFNENEILRYFSGGVLSAGDRVKVWYNDEHALALGVKKVIVKTSGGTTTMNFDVEPLLTNPGQKDNPKVGTTDLTGDFAGTDVSNRPLFPALFITDVTTDAMSLLGDWQFGGAAYPPSAIYGTWKAAVRTVDKTVSPTKVTLAMDNDPTENHWNLGPGADPVPSGLKDEGYGAEIVWNISDLPLQPGHNYRLQFMVHDGDQTKAGGDVGQNCVTVCIPPTAPAPGVAAPRLNAIDLMPSGVVRLHISGIPGRNYLIEGSENFSAWRSIATVQNNNGVLQFSDSARTTRSFYRVKLVP